MIVLKTRSEVLQYIHTERRKNNIQVGFVPTMGALHKGHLSLIETSTQENDLTVCSIFVNPTQFNESSDFEKYPRDFDQDITLLESVQCDVLFLPQASEMYSKKAVLSFNFGALENVMEGTHREGHFNGVALVVSKLFNIIQPNRTYFGQKDLQQCAIIHQLIEDLSFNIELIRCPIIREENGLAMSSRNRRLTTKEQEEAKVLYQALELTKSIIQETQNIDQAVTEAKQLLSRTPALQLEYLEVVDATTLQSISDKLKNVEIAICIAAFLGEVRLIDNLVFKG